ncbi:2Fe-2S iron-sulfur cluster-binding protein [Portibacter marinus]|uniref:2Fe-2S iron-sulfur cluster-binding protein n=1 Tax=Portibacter marinus TaxID=2898660 RepID=UPI001F295591|nr:2Fe-2S iron-sulfur cluster-binding protein [Portibacter marinus]
MAKITFITRDGESKTVEGHSGSVMELAVQNHIQGIDGDCGGVCSCATCHVHLSPEDMEKLGQPSEIEADMLELEDNVSSYSRLSCQLDVSDELDGMTLKVAN